MIDSDAHIYLGGDCYYRQIDELAINFSVAPAISDEQWAEYIQAGYVHSRKCGIYPKVSVAAFTGAAPNAKQRHMLASHLQQRELTPLVRIAVLTDSVVVRGAMTAFGWIMPTANLRAFDLADIAGGLRWLRQRAMFNEEKALAVWDEARARLLGRTHRPSRGPAAG